MRTSSVVRAALAAALLATATLARADHGGEYLDHEYAQRLHAKGEIVALESIVAQARSRQEGRLLEAKLERKARHYVYEVEILDNDGRVWELRFDARTGTFLEQEEEDR